ncbi:MAG: sugar-transfer associated ATP-grasp domain-containing protein [Candidatus Zixiibacteriota bacterium]
MRLPKNLFPIPSGIGVMGINARNLDMIYPYNRRNCFPNVDDKLLCKRLLQQNDIPTAVTYHVVADPPSLRNWEDKLAGVDHFVVKPNTGYGGNGIVLVTRRDGRYYISGEPVTREDIDFHIMQILNGAFSLDNLADTAFFEHKLVNHPGIQAFIPPEIEGVGDVRLIYRQEQIVMAMLRLPTRESGGKANLHQGGLGVGIDLDTGCSLHGSHRNNVITHHPETHEPLKGRPVPFFRDMLTYGARISDIVGLGYIGVDFVCDRDHGPMVLEVNARPGLNIQIANQAGLRDRLI